MNNRLEAGLKNWVPWSFTSSCADQEGSQRDNLKSAPLQLQSLGRTGINSDHPRIDVSHQAMSFVKMTILGHFFPVQKDLPNKKSVIFCAKKIFQTGETEIPKHLN